MRDGGASRQSHGGRCSSSWSLLFSRTSHQRHHFSLFTRCSRLNEASLWTVLWRCLAERGAHGGDGGCGSGPSVNAPWLRGASTEPDTSVASVGDQDAAAWSQLATCPWAAPQHAPAVSAPNRVVCGALERLMEWPKALRDNPASQRASGGGRDFFCFSARSFVLPEFWRLF